ncbi:MAG: hypothetical protein ACK5JU_07940 [Bacteroidales bacterium]
MTISELKKLMTDYYISSDTVKASYGLAPDKTFDEQFSAVSLENIIFSDVATAMYVMAELFDQFKIDISEILSSQLSGTVNWYAFKALLFQYGMELVPDTDYYDNTGLTADQINAMRIVKYAAAVESRDKSILYVKVATDDGSGIRQPLTSPQLTAFKQYLSEVQYAGVRIVVINDPADEMRLQIDIYYDSLVLDENGSRLDGTNDTPVQSAIRQYLENLPFNGTYTNQGLVDTLQLINGVRVAEIKSAASRYGAYETFTEINAREVAHAGYYSITEGNLIINLIADEELL